VCNPSTCQLDTSGCRERANCGNGLVDVGESCDGVDFGLLDGSCASYSSSFESGVLGCDGNCLISTENCVVGVDCGNGVLDVGFW